VADAGPGLGDCTRSSLQDLVVCGVPESVALSDMALGPEPSSAMGPEVSQLYLPGSPGSPPPPTN
jgi:hypothetical protein